MMWAGKRSYRKEQQRKILFISMSVSHFQGLGILITLISLWCLRIVFPRFYNSPWQADCFDASYSMLVGLMTHFLNTGCLCLLIELGSICWGEHCLQVMVSNGWQRTNVLLWVRFSKCTLGCKMCIKDQHWWANRGSEKLRGFSKATHA